MKRLSIDDIEKLPSVPEEEFEIEEWGFTILIRGINKGMQVKLGKLLNDENAETIDKLYEKDAKVIDQIFAKINELNGIGGSAEAEQF